MAENPAEEAENASNAEGGEEQATVENESEEDKKSEPLDDSAYEPPVRKSALPFILARKERQLEREKSKNEAEVEVEGEDLDVDTRVRQAVEPLYKAVLSRQDEFDVRDFLSNPSNAHFKKYEKLARKTLQNEAFKGVDVEFIFQALAYRDAESIGAEKARAQSEKSGNNRMSGGSVRRNVDFGSRPLTDKEFEDIQKRLARGETIQT